MPQPIDPPSGDRAPDSTDRPSGETHEEIPKGEMGGRVPTRKPEQYIPEGPARRRFHIPSCLDCLVGILFLASARHGHLLPHKDRSRENPDAPKPGAVMIFITAVMEPPGEGGAGINVGL